jgi:rifampicin phosphotransferase
MSSDKYVVPLDDKAAIADTCGSKAARLAQLLHAGLPVPKGFVVRANAFELVWRQSGQSVDREAIMQLAMPLDLVREVSAALAALGDGDVAVRSSGVGEDMADASFAGQYETVLNVQGADAVLQALKACWASTFSSRVAAYRQSRMPAGAARMAVLVQRQLEPEVAGVAFSANPLTGQRDETVINAVRGLGEKLVAGSREAEAWIVNGEEARITRETDKVLVPSQAIAIARLAGLVQSLFGLPQDIEWAIAGGKLFLLQARPIAALPDPVDWTAPRPGLWLRTFRIGEWLGDPITPLFESWLLKQLEEQLFMRLAQIVASVAALPYHVTVNGWYFTTANFLPRSIPHGIVLAVRQLLPALLRNPRAFSLLTTRFAHVGMNHFEREWRAGPKERYAAAVRSASERMESLNARELVRLVDELAALAGEELFYFFVVGGSAWKAEHSLARFYARHLAKDGAGSFQELLVGLGGQETTRNHAVVSLDWFQPTQGDLGQADETGVPAARKIEATRVREAATERALMLLREAPGKRRKFERLLARAQHFGRVREEQAVHLTLAWPVMRRAIELLAMPFLRRGILTSSSDAYFLTRDEICSESSAGTDSQQIVAARKERWNRQRRLTPPPYVGKMSGIRARILSGPERVFRMRAEAEDAASICGVPASPGRASGSVRVIRSPAEFGRLQQGEILVAPATSPAWTPLFACASAVVTDTGSAMAHASLVAREFGIPAVVGTGNATERLRDGQWVTVDGGKGAVLLTGQGEIASSVFGTGHRGSQKT